MIKEGNKIIKEEISVNPAKRNFLFHNFNEDGMKCVRDKFDRAFT